MKEPTLLDFLKEWLDFAENVDNGKESPLFYKDEGLCSAAYFYGGVKDEESNYVHRHPNTGQVLVDEMRRMFMKDFPGKSATFPFNSGADDFYAEADREESYKNPQRLAWVHKTIKELENA